MRTAGVAFVALALAARAGEAAAGAADAPPSTRPTPAQRRFCALLQACSLAAPPALCAGSASRERFDESRCQQARALAERGLAPESAQGFRLYQFLGSRHQVVYAVDGELRLSKRRLTFLLQDLPLAARLLSRFQKTRYSAEYLDDGRRHFRGNKDGKVSGEAELIAGAPDEGTLYYFGTGESRIAFWRLKGRGLVRAEYASADETGARLAYRIRVVASPANAVVNAVMRMGLFRSVVESEVREVLSDITEASAKLERGGLDAVEAAPGWSEDERDKLRAFLALH